MKHKYYNNGGPLALFLLISMFAYPLLLLYKKADTSIMGLIVGDLCMIGFIYLLYMPGSWDVYLYENKIIFRNEWNVLWRNEWEFALKEIVKVDIVDIAREGPGIRIFTKDSQERFHTLGFERTIELTKDLRQQGIKVESYLEKKLKPA